MYENKFYNLDEMGKFLERQILSKLTQSNKSKKLM